MFWLRNKKNDFQLHTLIWGPPGTSIARNNVWEVFVDNLSFFHTVLINHCGCIQFLIANLIVQKYEALCLKLSVTCYPIW